MSIIQQVSIKTGVARSTISKILNPEVYGANYNKKNRELILSMIEKLKKEQCQDTWAANNSR